MAEYHRRTLSRRDRRSVAFVLRGDFGDSDREERFLAQQATYLPGGVALQHALLLAASAIERRICEGTHVER